MEHKASFKLIVLLFVFSLVFTYVVAVPCSRSLKSIATSLSAQDQMVQEQFDEEDESSYVRGKMYLEINDYAGTGANTNHDPKPPGTGS